MSLLLVLGGASGGAPLVMGDSYGGVSYAAVNYAEGAALSGDATAAFGTATAPAASPGFTASAVSASAGAAFVTAAAGASAPSAFIHGPLSADLAYLVAVDWDQNGNYTGTYDDISADVTDTGGECFRGRSEPHPITGRASAGTFQVQLHNQTGKYSRFNAASPLYGLMLPGRSVRFQTVQGDTTRTVWSGFLDDIVANPDRTATLTASGPFVKLVEHEVVIASTGSTGTGAAIGTILTAASWPAGDRSLDTGVLTLNTYFAQPARALEGMREIEDTELGFLFESADGKIVFHARNRRTTNAASTSSQAHFSDGAGSSLPYVRVSADVSPLARIINHVKLEVYTQELAAATEVWTHDFLPVAMAASANRVFTATLEPGRSWRRGPPRLRGRM